MGVMPLAQEFVRVSSCPVIIAEGDRLASLKFLDVAAETRKVILVYCKATRSTIIERREMRGTSQSESWLRGRQTKVTNLWNNARNCERFGLDMTLPLEQRATIIQNMIIGDTYLSNTRNE
jgi:hypothetical protein